MKLTPKQEVALREAAQKGELFQLPERRKHSPHTLAALVKAGLLRREPVGVVWTLTEEGRAVLNT